jgi:CRP-like cAMP-binding protein
VQFDSTAFVADPELLEALEARASAIHCETDRTLFAQGEYAVGLYIIRQGRATLSMRAGGATVLAVETGAGSLLGLPGVIGNQPYSMSAIARAGADLGFIGREEFAAMMHSEPKLSLKILQVLAAEVRTARAALH